MSSKIQKKHRELGRRDRAMRRKARGQLVRCVHCRALNTQTAGKCWKCGADL